MKVNLLKPGALKAGTSALKYYLLQHPEVYLAYKELNFFNINYR